jgi:hypothetical protein
MLEIIILIKLCGRISANAKKKGWPGWPFGLGLFFMWFVAEVVGLIVGAILLGDSLVVYLLAIGSAALAAVVAFGIVGALPARTAQSGRWRPAEDLLDLNDSDTDGEIRRGDLVYAPVEIRDGDLLRLEHDNDGRVRLQTVFEDELLNSRGIFRAEYDSGMTRPRLMPAKVTKWRADANGDGPTRGSTQIQREPPAD